MKKIKCWVTVVLVCLLTFTGSEAASLNIGVSTVQAKTSLSTKQKAQNAYRKFLAQNRLNIIDCGMWIKMV